MSSATIPPSKKLRISDDDRIFDDVVIPKKRIIPINHITIYIEVWRICGICYHNDSLKDRTGNARVLSFYLMDEHGSSVKISAFHHLAQTFHHIVRKRVVYYITADKSCIKLKNVRFNKSTADYEIVLNEKSKVELCIDREIKMPDLVIQRKFIKNIQASMCEADFMTIIHQVGELETIVLSNEDLLKREFTLVDQSLHSISFVTWGENAKIPVGKIGDVFVIKYAKINFYHGSTNLSKYGYTQYAINPEQFGVDEIKTWYKAFGSNAMFTSLTRSFKPLSYEDEGRSLAAGVTIAQKNMHQIVRFTSKVEINDIETEFSYYRGCKECQHKMVFNAGKFSCPNCNKVHDGKFYYILKIILCDTTGAIEATVYDTLAEKMLGISASSLQKIREKNESAYKKALYQILFQSISARIRSTFDKKSGCVAFIVTDIKCVPLEEYEHQLEKCIEMLEQ